MKNLLLFLSLFANDNIHQTNTYDLQINFLDSLVYEKAPKGIRDSFNSSIIIYSINMDEVSCGSANLIDFEGQEVFLTAEHVITNSLFLYGVEKNGNKIGLEIIFKDPEKDIAILKPIDKTTVTKSVKFKHSKKDKIGSNVYHCGHPIGISFNVSEGIITSIKDRAYVINSFSLPGSSGSVVFDEDGNVIGVLLSIAVYNEQAITNIVLVTPIDDKYISQSLK